MVILKVFLNFLMKLKSFNRVIFLNVFSSLLVESFVMMGGFFWCGVLGDYLVEFGFG